MSNNFGTHLLQKFGHLATSRLTGSFPTINTSAISSENVWYHHRKRQVARKCRPDLSRRTYRDCSRRRILLFAIPTQIATKFWTCGAPHGRPKVAVGSARALLEYVRGQSDRGHWKPQEPELAVPGRSGSGPAGWCIWLRIFRSKSEVQPQCVGKCYLYLCMCISGIQKIISWQMMLKWISTTGSTAPTLLMCV